MQHGMMYVQVLQFICPKALCDTQVFRAIFETYPVYMISINALDAHVAHRTSLGIGPSQTMMI